jgi:hypothetical protein
VRPSPQAEALASQYEQAGLTARSLSPLRKQQIRDTYFQEQMDSMSGLAPRIEQLQSLGATIRSHADQAEAAQRARIAGVQQKYASLPEAKQTRWGSAYQPSLAEMIGAPSPTEQQISDFARFGATAGTPPTGRRQRYFDAIAQAQEPALAPWQPRTTPISNQEILDAAANAQQAAQRFVAGSAGNYLPTRSGRGIMPSYLIPTQYREAGAVGNTPLDFQRMQLTNQELAGAAAAGQPLAPRAYFGDTLQDLQQRPQRLAGAQARKALAASAPLPTGDPDAMLALAQSGNQAARQFLAGQKAQARSDARRRRMGNLSHEEALRFGSPEYALEEMRTGSQRDIADIQRQTAEAQLEKEAQRFAAQNQLGWAGAYNNLLGTMGQQQLGWAGAYNQLLGTLGDQQGTQFSNQATVLGALPQMVERGLITPEQAQKYASQFLLQVPRAIGTQLPGIGAGQGAASAAATQGADPGPTLPAGMPRISTPSSQEQQMLEFKKGDPGWVVNFLKQQGYDDQGVNRELRRLYGTGMFGTKRTAQSPHGGWNSFFALDDRYGPFYSVDEQGNKQPTALGVVGDFFAPLTKRALRPFASVPDLIGPARVLSDENLEDSPEDPPAVRAAKRMLRQRQNARPATWGDVQNLPGASFPRS